MNRRKAQSCLKAFFKNIPVRPVILINENDDEFIYCGCYIKKDNLKNVQELMMKKGIVITQPLEGFYVKVEERLSNVNSFHFLRQYNSSDYYTLLKANNKVYCVNQEYLELFDNDATFEINVYNDISMVRVKEKDEIVGYIPTYSEDFVKAFEVKAYDNEDKIVCKFFQERKKDEKI